MIRSILTAALAATALSIGLAPAARAQEPAAAGPEETPFVTLSGTAAFLTDYRFRGVSLSDTDIVGQASLTATTQFGLFAGIWGSTIEPIGATENSNGAEQEIDLTVGYTKPIGAFTPTIGVVGYIYPGGANVDYYEVFGSVSAAAGPVALTVGANYAPDQDNTVEDNIYVFGLAAFGIPDTPFTVKASVGYEDGAFDFGPGSKIDYMAGVDFKFRFMTLGVQYVGNDLGSRSVALRRIRKDGVVFSATAAF